MSEGYIIWYHPLWMELQRELKNHHPWYWRHLQHNSMSEAGFFYWINLQLGIAMSPADVTMEEALQVWIRKLVQKRSLSIVQQLPIGMR